MFAPIESMLSPAPKSTPGAHVLISSLTTGPRLARDLAWPVARVERGVRVDALAGIDVSLGSTEDSHLAQLH